MDANQIKLIEDLSELFLENSVIEKEIATYSKSEIENVNPYDGKKERSYKIEGIIASSATEFDAYAIKWLFDTPEFKALEMIKVLAMLTQTVDPDRIKDQIPSLAGLPNYLVKQAKEALNDKSQRQHSNAGIEKAKKEALMHMNLLKPIFKKLKNKEIHLTTAKGKPINPGDYGWKAALIRLCHNESCNGQVFLEGF